MRSPRVRQRRVEVINAHPRRFVQKRPIRQLVRAVGCREGMRVGELNVVFVNDRAIRRLNRTYLNRDQVTDVISFPLGSGNQIEGEVYVNLDQAVRQAKHFHVRATDEFRRLVVHGLLHLAGYEDATKAKREDMHRLENQYLKWKNPSSS